MAVQQPKKKGEYKYMQISLIQGILLALMAFVAAVDQQWEAFFWFRPIVVAFFAGIILGNVQLGLQAGAVAELAYLGLLTVGGTVPPDPLIAGIMTTVIAYTTGQSAETALGLSLPFALLAQWVGIFFNSAYSGFMGPLDRAAEKADVKKFKFIVYSAIVIKATVVALIVFLSAYAMQAPISNFVSTFPVFLIHGFEIAGGLLPAVGLALLLRIMLKADNAAYLFIGFLMATYLKLGNVLPIAIAGIAVGYIGYMNDKHHAKLSVATEGGSEDDGI